MRRGYAKQNSAPKMANAARCSTLGEISKVGLSRRGDRVAYAIKHKETQAPILTRSF
jgi:hypothetical protein